jgi:anti-anti-sigma factor
MPTFELRRVPAFNVVQERIESAVVFTFDGRLTIESDPSRLEQVLVAIDQSCADHVVVDLTHVRQLDCAGIGWLVRLRNEACACGETFALVDADRFQKRVLELLGLLRVFRVFDTRTDALAWSGDAGAPASAPRFRGLAGAPTRCYLC